VVPKLCTKDNYRTFGYLWSHRSFSAPQAITVQYCIFVAGSDMEGAPVISSPTCSQSRTFANGEACSLIAYPCLHNFVLHGSELCSQLYTKYVFEPRITIHITRAHLPFTWLCTWPKSFLTCKDQLSHCPTSRHICLPSPSPSNGPVSADSVCDTCIDSPHCHASSCHLS